MTTETPDIEKVRYALEYLHRNNPLGSPWTDPPEALQALTRIEAERKALREALEWKPIISCPTNDGKDYLLLSDKGVVCIGKFNQQAWIGYFPQGTVQIFYPTHWMNLPRPTVSTENKTCGCMSADCNGNGYTCKIAATLPPYPPRSTKGNKMGIFICKKCGKEFFDSKCPYCGEPISAPQHSESKTRAKRNLE